ncbi:MAG: ABC transporter substrate-binding protein, partial [Candidatus Rokubacteria bacterium]|nr:ABC transporter substrate-binding protein [Candidatus Rokubacteria bacterium]
MDRRKFLGKAGATLAASAAVTLTKAPNVIAQPKFQWRLVTSWPPSFEILNGTAQRFARQVDEMSGGRLKIQMYTAGELIPPLGVFDAVSNGSIDAYSSGPYFWAGKEPAMQWFCAVPFGLNAQGMYSWFYQGGGLKLMEEAYQPFNLVPRPGGGTGAQMGGWFRKKINTIADYKGL